MNLQDYADKLEKKSLDELVEMLEQAKAIHALCLDDPDPVRLEQAHRWLKNERRTINGVIKAKSRASTLLKTRTGLHITGGITLRQWLVIEDMDEELQPEPDQGHRQRVG